MDGDTTFHFVTDGIHEALRRTREAAGSLDVRVAGGAATVRQYLQARSLDELHVAVVPTLRGGGEQLSDSTLSGLPQTYDCARAEGTGRTLHVLLVRRGEG
jgi:dihydrofolate reductase